MKGSIFSLIIMSLFFMTSCKKGDEAVKTEDAKEVKKEVVSSTAYKIDTDASTVTWEGSKLAGKHTGTLKVNSGSWALKDGNVVSGNFAIDMSSLTVTDLTGKDKGKLEGHLMSADFFNAAQYPTSAFVVTDCRKTAASDSGITHQLTGNLTMLDETKSVTIPLKVTSTGDAFMATSPSFMINRTEWGIKYGSGLIGAAKDKAISDDMAISLNIKGSKI